MGITIEISLPTWFVAATLASLLLLLLWASRAEGSRARRADGDEKQHAARNRGEEGRGQRGDDDDEGPPSEDDDDWSVVIELHEPEQPNVFFFTENGWRVHTSSTCSGLRNARKILKSNKHVGGKTRCKICFRKA